MFSLLLAFAPGAAVAATTLLTLDSGEDVEAGSDTLCLFDETVTATARATLNLTEAAVVDFTGITMTLRGRHGICEVGLDYAALTLEGEELWSQALSASGSGEAFTDWYLEQTYGRSDMALVALDAGSYTFELTLEGTAQSIAEAVGAQLVVEVEYGRDWDDDGYESEQIAESGDCDDRSADTYPGAPELDDGLDNDCDERVEDWDDGDPGTVDPGTSGGDTGDTGGGGDDTGSGGEDTGDDPGQGTGDGEDTGEGDSGEGGGTPISDDPDIGSPDADEPVGLIGGGACSALPVAPAAGWGLAALLLGWRRRRA